MHTLRYRQIHLDFHTSEQIEGIGADFDASHWQRTLQDACVDSITCFAKCHHGMSYYDTKVGVRHPHLVIDLLRAQYDASKEVDINVPIYVSAGFDQHMSHVHPEWVQVDREGAISGWMHPAYRMMCFNGPYLDFLCDQIQEVVQLFPEADGIFLDIISQPPCYCRWCRETMEREGLDIENESHVAICADKVLQRYYERTTAACRSVRDDMPVFHNSGHIRRDNRSILEYNSHLELESLPTGGWGYDHFPLSAAYVSNLPFDYLGMTGKFHTTWGEFGGYKHPNALRFECAAMLANGAKCSIGDQLPPRGRLDDSTYRLIGKAYTEVQAKESWCGQVRRVADVGVLSHESAGTSEVEARQDNSADTGAGRLLLESHILFDLIDPTMDFSKYKVLVLPDGIRVDTELHTQLQAYLDQGGKLFMTGTSGMNPDATAFAFDIGAEYAGPSPYQPDFVLPNEHLRPELVDSPFVMYTRSRRIKVTSGQSLGQVYDPYFNRTIKHFCSHQHAPATQQASGYDCGVHLDTIVYLAHPVFSLYRHAGTVAYKQYVTEALRLLLDRPTVADTNLPSQARIVLQDQPHQNRYVLHLLYGPAISRGGMAAHHEQLPLRVGSHVEVIEDLPALHGIEVSLRLDKPVNSAKLSLQGETLPMTQDGDLTKLRLDTFTCHQMIDLAYS